MQNIVFKNSKEKLDKDFINNLPNRIYQDENFISDCLLKKGLSIGVLDERFKHLINDYLNTCGKKRYWYFLDSNFLDNFPRKKETSFKFPTELREPEQKESFLMKIGFKLMDFSNDSEKYYISFISALSYYINMLNFDQRF